MAKISVFGRLGSDAEKKKVNDKDVINFNVAENQKSVDKQTGEYKEYPVWYQCTMFTKSEKIIKHLKKGNKVVVDGNLTFNDYKSPSGEIKHGKNITVKDLILIDFEEDTETTEQNQDSDDLPF